MSTDKVRPDVEYLSVKEVSERLGVSRGCIYELVEQGLLAHLRIGVGRGTIRIPIEALEQYIAHAKVDRSDANSMSDKKSRHESFSHLNAQKLISAWNAEN